jgi:uroporphyrinogen-III synthase
VLGRGAALRRVHGHRVAIAQTYWGILAIGPVVSAELERHGVTATVMPSGTYFMKPMVSAIIAATSR